MQGGGPVNKPLGKFDAFAFVSAHERKRAPLSLAKGNHNPALAGLMFRKTAIFSVGLEVGGSNVAPKIGTIDLNLTGERSVFLFAGESFTNLVNDDESRFVLHVQIASELKRADALRRVCNDADRG